MPVPSQESDQLCVLGLSILPVSTIFRLDFGLVLMVYMWYLAVNGNHVSDFRLVLMVYMWYLAVNGNHVSDFGLVLMVYMWYLAVNDNHVSIISLSV
jgi:hypothetical protein